MKIRNWRRSRGMWVRSVWRYSIWGAVEASSVGGSCRGQGRKEVVDTRLRGHDGVGEQGDVGGASGVGGHDLVTCFHPHVV